MSQHIFLYAMKQALEDLLDAHKDSDTYPDSIRSLRLAIEQAEKQEPVAILHRFPSRGFLTVDYTDEITEVPEGVHGLYTAPPQQEKQEPVAWKNAAIRLGEELSSVGPDGYYDMNAEQWLTWAMDQQPRGKNSLAAPPCAAIAAAKEEA